MNTENNKLIAEFYMADIDGLIYSLRRGIALKNRVNKNGYLQANLWVKGKQYTRLVHRMVAEKWLPNPKSLPEVNHIDGNKLNNHAKNLEWVTRSENIRHGINTGLIPAPWKGKQGNVHPKSKSVYKCDGCGFPIAEYESVRLAAKHTGIHHNLIYDNIKGKLRSAGGFIWKYK
jgi:hypothetical protein